MDGVGGPVSERDEGDSSQTVREAQTRDTRSAPDPTRGSTGDPDPGAGPASADQPAEGGRAEADDPAAQQGR
jgi:hypothetical protein